MGPTRAQFAGALAGAALVLFGLYVALVGPGLGGTGDSRYYLTAAQGLRAFRQPLGADGTPYRFWGPLFPALLAVFSTSTALRWLHGAALLSHLAVWSLVGRQLLPGRRALVLPLALALSTAVLVPAKFIWSETVFISLVAAYAALLAAWLRTRQAQWLGWATVAGFWLPLQRTSGVFLLAGAGLGLLLSGAWRGRDRLRLVAHGAICASGAAAWGMYAELAGPPEIYPAGNLLIFKNVVADYGFVLLRWVGPLAAGWRAAVPATSWVVVLVALLAALWPRAKPAQLMPPVALLRVFWWMVLGNIVGHVLAVTHSRGMPGPHDAERYLVATVGPVLLLAFARWPAAGTSRLSQLLNTILLVLWLSYSAVRVVHNVVDLRQRPAYPWALPGPAKPR